MKYPRLREFAIDALVCLALVGGYLSCLLRTVRDLGYARDEGFYFQAADAYRQWFRVLWERGAPALKRSSVDQYWQVNHEHPALVKSLFAAARAWLFDEWHLFPDPGTSYRFVGMCFGALTLVVIYTWARRIVSARNVFQSRLGAAVAALSFGCIPVVFYHSHLDCFDIPVASMWFLTAYAYWESARRRSWILVLLVGVLYGLLLNTKHNSWLLPFALIAHLLLTRWRWIVDGLRRFRLRVPPALFAMALLGPAVFYGTWPWIWFDTVRRLHEYVVFHTAHVYYNMEFLGKTYFRPPFPLSYAWVMTAATVPAVTLVLCVLGIALYGRGSVIPALLRTRARLREQRLGAWIGGRGATAPAFDLASTQTLWAVCILTSYAPWLSSRSPIFGGTKHWMTAYPFLMLFVAQALAVLFGQAGEAVTGVKPAWSRWSRPVVELGIAACVLVGPAVMTWQSHPWGLGAYMPLVGSGPGAASLGLNRSFWGYSTGAVQEFVNQAAPKSGRIFVHDTALQSWQMMEADGRLRKDLRPQLDVSGSQIGIYHHEQHMALVEAQIWVEYGTTQPARVGTYQGVPVVWVYTRPGITPR